MPSIPAPVIAAKQVLRAASDAARDARKAWTRERDSFYHDGFAVNVERFTCAMWDAEKRLAHAAEAWRVLLAERLSMPSDDRWSIADAERLPR